MTSVAAGTNATVIIDDNDTSGSITIVTDDNAQAATQTAVAHTAPTAENLVKLTYNDPYDKLPRVIVAGGDRDSAKLHGYQSLKSKTWFNFGVDGTPQPQTTYVFECFVVQ